MKSNARSCVRVSSISRSWPSALLAMIPRMESYSIADMRKYLGWCVGWVGLVCGLGCVGLGWVGLGWVGLGGCEGWVGLEGGGRDARIAGLN